MIKENKFYSFQINSLCKGCKDCVKGRKTVLYITGICPRKCYYCPLSDEKKNKDVIFANEKKIKNYSELEEECIISKSIGVGITGGDPLAKLDRTIEYIKKLKNKFGPKFHIHLYTSLNLISKEKLEKLYLAGLDEIRVHPDLDDETLWEKIKLLKEFSFDVGIEIPLLTGYYKNIKKLIQFSNTYIDFMNLNEFEYSDTNGDELEKRGFFCKSLDSCAVAGSKNLGLRILKFCDENYPKLKMHLCTAKLKDAIQISNRLKIRSQSISKDYDLITKEGLIIRGVIKTNKQNLKKIQNQFDIPSSLIAWDNLRKEIIIAGWVLTDIVKELPYKCELVKEYPSSDRMIVEVDPLN